MAQTIINVTRTLLSTCGARVLLDSAGAAGEAVARAAKGQNVWGPCGKPSVVIRVIVVGDRHDLSGHYECKVGHIEVKPLEF